MDQVLKQFRINIRPCPFCNSDDITYVIGDHKIGGFKTQLMCNHCKARGPVNYTEPGRVENQTILNWNEQF